MLLSSEARALCLWLCLLAVFGFTDIRASGKPCEEVALAIYIPSYGIIPESYPSAQDGGIIVNMLGTPVAPFIIILNGQNYDTIATGPNLLAGNLHAGTYTVQVLDGSGQLSNTVTGTVPLNNPNLRAANFRLEPVIYTSYNETDTIPDYADFTHGWLSFDMLPGSTFQYLNVRFTHPYNFTSHWLVRNLPLPPVAQVERMWYRINIEELGDGYAFLDFRWATTTNYDRTCAPNPNCAFCCNNSLEIHPLPQVAARGCDEPGPVIGDAMPPLLPPLLHSPGPRMQKLRTEQMPNIDLDCSTYYPTGDDRPGDWNACAASSVSNGLTWIAHLHDEMDTMAHRAMLDSLKIGMHLAKSDADGVQFDSTIIGVLSFIDQMQIPVAVSYQTIHASGNAMTLTSLDPDNPHSAENAGDSDAFPEFIWFKERIDDTSAVQVQIGWYGPPGSNGVRPRMGSHWLSGQGYFKTDSLLGVYLYDDADQSGPGTRRVEYFVWDTLVGNIPYLQGLSDGAGRIAIVESLVSEKFDPSIQFEGCGTMVQSTEDGGPGSLRALVGCMAGGDTLILSHDLAGDTILLTTSPIVFDQSIVLLADPADEIYIRADDIMRLFEIGENATVTLQGMRLICGNGDEANCILNAGTVILKDLLCFDQAGFSGGPVPFINHGVLKIDGSVELRHE